MTTRWEQEARERMMRSSGTQLLSYYRGNPDAGWPEYKMREIASELARENSAARRGLGDSQRLDRKWNNGRESGDTYWAREHVKKHDAEVDRLAQGYKDTVVSPMASPRERENAETTLRRLYGSKWRSHL
jgi:hypothetical protein